MSLTIAMIVRDEQATLERVLRQASACSDELVVVDTGSLDRSVEIAKECGATVSHFEWIDDFAAARNFAFDQATCDWVMWLDADDVLPEASQLLIRELGSVDPSSVSYDQVVMTYVYNFAADGQPTETLERERMVARQAGYRWFAPVHEVLPYAPDERRLDRRDILIEHRPGPREHKSGRNLRILQAAYQRGDRSERTLFYLAREMFDSQLDNEALAISEEFLSLEAPRWERYAALISMASGLRRLDRAGEAVSRLHEAMQVDPTRPEAPYQLGLHYYEAGLWREGVPWFAAATQCGPCHEGIVQRDAYGWRAWDFLGVCLANSGRAREALTIWLEHSMGDHGEQERVRANIQSIAAGL